MEAGDSVFAAVSEPDGEILAYADIRFIPGEVQIYRIAVAPGFREQGTGEALLRHILRAGIERGCGLATLEVKAGNSGAISLYRKLGFTEAGRRRKYYNDGGDALLMSLEIRESVKN